MIPFDFVQIDVENVNRNKSVVHLYRQKKKRAPIIEKEDRHEKFSAGRLFTMSLRLSLRWSVMAFEETTTTTTTTTT